MKKRANPSNALGEGHFRLNLLSTVAKSEVDKTFIVQQYEHDNHWLKLVDSKGRPGFSLQAAAPTLGVL